MMRAKSNGNSKSVSASRRNQHANVFGVLPGFPSLTPEQIDLISRQLDERRRDVED
jgi:hypothetical protein